MTKKTENIEKIIKERLFNQSNVLQLLPQDVTWKPVNKNPETNMITEYYLFKNDKPLVKTVLAVVQGGSFDELGNFVPIPFQPDNVKEFEDAIKKNWYSTFNIVLSFKNIPILSEKDALFSPQLPALMKYCEDIVAKKPDDVSKVDIPITHEGQNGLINFKTKLIIPVSLFRKIIILKLTSSLE